MSKSNIQRTINLDIPHADKIDIEFDNLKYIVGAGKGKKEILHGINGMFKSGELTGIMGPSGAGKSTLLNILSGFLDTGATGEIRSTGQEEKFTGKIRYKKEACYILQDDRLCPYFTVEEIMTMAAKLKLGTSIASKSMDGLILDILESLGLKTTLKTRCGRLSGGQKKRLSIALELIDNPPIIFLDEPTTGLDSSTSLQCIRMLKQLAREGRTIVCTIHQPSATMYEMFDHIYVLASGHCIYQGGAVNSVPYLRGVGLQCPCYHNPADYMLEVANCEYGDYVEILAKAAKEGSWRNPSTSATDEKISDRSANKSMIMVRAPSEFYRFQILLKRCILQLYRDWTVTHLKMFLHTIVGIFVGILYLNYGNDGSKSVKNIGYLIISIVYLAYTSMMPAIVKLPSEVPVLKKENFNNWYKLRTYYCAYITATVPIQIVFAIIYTAFSYPITAQPIEVHRILMFLAILILVTLAAESMGVVIGTIVNPVITTHMKIVINILLAIILGVVFYGFGANGARTFSNVGFTILSLAYVAFTALMPAVCKFPAEVHIIKKESYNGWYHLSTYYLASFISSIPLQAIISVTFSVIAFVMTQHSLELPNLGLFSITLFLSCLVSEALGIILGVLLDPINGTFVGSVLTAIFILLGGFLILFEHMSPTFYITTYFNYYAYAFDALVHSVYGFGQQRIPCPKYEEFCLFTDPKDVLHLYGVENFKVENDIFAMIVMMVVLKIVGYITLKWKI